MVTWAIRYSRQAAKDIARLKQAGLADKAKQLVDVIAADPWKNPPPYEKLVGDLFGAYSRRINRQHRLVYTVDVEEKTVYIHSLWSHYER